MQREIFPSKCLCYCLLSKKRFIVLDTPPACKEYMVVSHILARSWHSLPLRVPLHLLSHPVLLLLLGWFTCGSLMRDECQRGLECPHSPACINDPQPVTIVHLLMPLIQPGRPQTRPLATPQAGLKTDPPPVHTAGWA